MNTNLTLHRSRGTVGLMRDELNAAVALSIPGLMLCARCRLDHVDPSVADDCSMISTRHGWVCAPYNGCDDRDDEHLTLSAWLTAQDEQWLTANHMAR
jgi:hypothetical protein